MKIKSKHRESQHQHTNKKRLLNKNTRILAIHRKASLSLSFLSIPIHEGIQLYLPIPLCLFRCICTQLFSVSLLIYKTVIPCFWGGLPKNEGKIRVWRKEGAREFRKTEKSTQTTERVKKKSEQREEDLIGRLVSESNRR